MPYIRISIDDAIELAELLQFIRDWITTDPIAATSLDQYVGTDHQTDSLCEVLDRLLFLLGGTDGEHFLTP